MHPLVWISLVLVASSACADQSVLERLEVLEETVLLQSQENKELRKLIEYPRAGQQQTNQ